jgi:hypothetical protein
LVIVANKLVDPEGKIYGGLQDLVVAHNRKGLEVNHYTRKNNCVYICRIAYDILLEKEHHKNCCLQGAIEKGSFRIFLLQEVMQNLTCECCEECNEHIDTRPF